MWFLLEVQSCSGGASWSVVGPSWEHWTQTLDLAMLVKMSWVLRGLCVMGLLMAMGCRPSFPCPPRHHHVYQLQCPPCSESHPCACAEAWTCQIDADYAEQQRQQWLKKEAERKQAAAEEEAQRLRVEAELRNRQAALSAEAARLAEEQRLAREAERQRRISEGIAAPLQLGPSLCAQPCPGGMPRIVSFLCPQSAADGTRLTTGHEICPRLHQPSEQRCAVQWESHAQCLPVEPKRAAHCGAGSGQCCLDDGTVIRPCGPLARPGRDCMPTYCGNGGFCTRCR